MSYPEKNKVSWFSGFYLMYQLFKKVICFFVVLFFLSLPILANRAEECKAPMGRIFDCGANCLYIISQIQGRPVSYEKCLELLPLSSSQGNSMLQLKDALEAMSYQVYAMSVSAEELKYIKVPTIVRDNFGQPDRKLGHYLIMQPLSGNRAQIFDYPKNAKIVSLVDLFESKNTENLKNISVLLCCDKVRSLDEVFDSRSKGSETLSEINPDIPLVCDTSRVEINGTNKKYSSAHDFGEKPEGSEFSHKFVIQNNSTKTLIVEKVIASCQCSAIEIDKNEIPPKEEATVNMDISLDRKYGNVAIRGTVIFSPHNRISPLVLSVKGSSFERWICYPNMIDLGEIEPDNLEVAKSIILERKIQGTDTLISDVKPNSKYLKAQLESITPDKAILHLTFMNNGVTGPFRGRVDIFLDGEKIPATHIDVSASIKTDYIVSPRKIFFSCEPDVENKKRVIITSADKEPFIINSIKVEEISQNTVESEYWFNNEKNELTFDAIPLNNCRKATGCFIFDVNKQGIDHVIRVPFVIVP